MQMFVIRFLFGLFIGVMAAGATWAQLTTSAKSAVVATPQVRAELVAHMPEGVQTGKT